MLLENAVASMSGDSGRGGSLAERRRLAAAEAAEWNRLAAGLIALEHRSATDPGSVPAGRIAAREAEMRLLCERRLERMADGAGDDREPVAESFWDSAFAKTVFTKSFRKRMTRKPSAGAPAEPPPPGLEEGLVKALAYVRKRKKEARGRSEDALAEVSGVRVAAFILLFGPVIPILMWLFPAKKGTALNMKYRYDLKGKEKDQYGMFG